MIDLTTTITTLALAAIVTEVTHDAYRFVKRKTKAVAATANASTINHSSILPVVLDVFVLVCGLIAFIWSYAANQVATTRFVVATEALCGTVFLYGLALRRDWRRFRPQHLGDVLE